MLYLKGIMREVSWSKAVSGVLHAASFCWSRVLPCRCLSGSPGCTPSWLTSTGLQQQLSKPVQMHHRERLLSHRALRHSITNKSGDQVLRERNETLASAALPRRAAAHRLACCPEIA